MNDEPPDAKRVECADCGCWKHDCGCVEMESSSEYLDTMLNEKELTPEQYDVLLEEHNRGCAEMDAEC